MMVDCQKEWGFCGISALLLMKCSNMAPLYLHSHPLLLITWTVWGLSIWSRGRIWKTPLSCGGVDGEGLQKRTPVVPAREIVWIPQPPPPTHPPWWAHRALQDAFLKKSRLTPSAPLLNEIPTLSRCQRGKPETGHRASHEVWGFVTGPLLTDQTQ